MEDFLTDCLLGMRSNWEKLEELKYFLQSNWVSDEYYYFSNQILKSLNDVLRSFNGEKPQQPEYLHVLMETLHFVVVKNKSMSFWNDLGLELGESCVKILILIEKSDEFENLFEKLLMILRKSVEETSNVWKSMSRPILNVFINKNFSFEFMEKAFGIYVSLLEKVEKLEVSKFSAENLSLVKTFFTKIPNIGDFQIQQNIMKIVFLHLNEEILIRSFFHEEELDFFKQMNSNNFECLCRKYLNEINKRAERRRVFSVGCQTISLRGRHPLFLQNKKVIWVDASKDTQRLTINCIEINNENINIPFSNIRKVENEKTLEGEMRITITSKTNENTTENIVFKIHESSEKDGIGLIDFLNEIRKSRKLLGHKLSQTCDLIHINREELEEMTKSNSQNSSKRVQINTITSSVGNGFRPEKVSTRPFIDSFNKNIMTSPKFRNAQKLFTSSLKEVSNVKENQIPNTFDRKSNKSFNSVEMEKENQSSFLHPSLEFQKKYEDKLFESQSSCQEYFRCEKKPLWTKLKIKSKRYSGMKKDEDRNKEKEEQKPSLLDPNGYTYKRWMQPTTSKRSNFWLEKLKNLEREKQTSRDEFEFSGSSSAHIEKKSKTKTGNKAYRKKGKKKNLVIFKRKNIEKSEKANNIFESIKKNVTEMKKPEKPEFCLNVQTEKESEAGNIFKETETKPEDTSRRCVSEYDEAKWIPKTVEESFDEDIFENLEMCHQTNKEAVQNEQEKSFDEDLFKNLEGKENNGEEVLEERDRSSDGVPNEKRYKKSEEEEDKEREVLEERDRSVDGVPNEKRYKKSEEEEGSVGVKTATKFLKKRKLKMFPIPLKIKIFQDKVKKAEQKARKETEEIIETVNEATENFIRRLEKKDFAKVTSYLRVLEEVGPEISDAEEILNRSVWLQRFRHCYESRLSDQTQEISEIRDVLGELVKNAVNYSRSFVKMCGNLKNLLEKGIQKRMKDELRERRQKFQEMRISDLL